MRAYAPVGCSALPVRVATLNRLLGSFGWIFWLLFVIRLSGFIDRREH